MNYNPLVLYHLTQIVKCNFALPKLFDRLHRSADIKTIDSSATILKISFSPLSLQPLFLIKYVAKPIKTTLLAVQALLSPTAQPAT